MASFKRFAEDIDIRRVSKPLFSDFLPSYDQLRIRKGFNSFVKILKKNYEKVEPDKSDYNAAVHRLFDLTRDYLVFIGVPEKKSVLENLLTYWENINSNSIGKVLKIDNEEDISFITDAFKARIEEASYEEPEVAFDVEPEELGEDEFEYLSFVDEEPPQTQRNPEVVELTPRELEREKGKVLVAKLLDFVNIFVKGAEGNYEKQ